MEEYRRDYPISVLCETLGVSLSGYHAWKNRPLSQHQREDNQLAEHIHVVYHACRQVYGSPRIHAELPESRASPSPANGWLASCENRACLLLGGIIGRPRPEVNLERVLRPICWSKILPRVVRMRSGRVILQPFGPMKAGSTWLSYMDSVAHVT